MPNIVVVNGESYWPAYFPGQHVHRTRLQACRWLLRPDGLWLLDEAGSLRVDGVLWRLGAVRPHPSHRAALEMIRLSGVPCVNPARVLGRGYERLSMLAELREAGVPTLPLSVALGEGVLQAMRPALPAVLKVGNFHGGRGKARASSEGEWLELADLLFVSEDYVCVEPFVDYARDVRCLLIGGQMWAMERRGATWKVQAGAADHALIEAPPALAEHTRRACKYLGADVLALDFLESRHGEFFALESNDIPGLSGFPEATRHATAQLLRDKVEAAGA